MAQIKLDSVQLAEHCYEHMFEKNTKITEIPDLPATTLQKRCYSYMFAGCSGINKPSAPSSLSTDLTNIIFNNDGEIKILNVYSNTNWTTQLKGTDASQFSLNCNSGSLNKQIFITALPNASSSSKNATLEIKTSDLSQTVTVDLIQNTSSSSLIAQPSSLSFNFLASTSRVDVFSDKSWTAELTGETSQFSIDKTSGTRNDSIFVTVLDNGSKTKQYNASLVITDSDNNKAIVSLKQLRMLDIFCVVPSTPTLKFNSAGETKQLTVYAPTPGYWRVYITGQAKNNYSVSQNTGSSGFTYITTTVLPNSTTIAEEQNAKLSFQYDSPAEPGRTQVVDIPVSQYSYDMSISVYPVLGQYPSVGGDTTALHNFSYYDLKLSDDTQPWIAYFTPDSSSNFSVNKTSGIGSDALQFNCAYLYNIHTKPMAQLNIELANDPSKRTHISLEQFNGTSAKFKPTTAIFSAAGETKVFNIISNISDYSISVDNTQFTIDKTSGSMNETLTVTALPNASKDIQYANITIYDNVYLYSVAGLKITQAPGN